MTPGQNYRRQRNLAIGLLASMGVTQVFLATVFDLSRWRVTKILDAIEAEFGEAPESSRRESSRRRDLRSSCVAGRLRKVTIAEPQTGE